MVYRIFIEDEKIWRKDCSKIPSEQVRQILLKIRKLEEDPWAGNVQVKQLKNYEIANFRLRVGEYRILFNKDEAAKIINLLRVMHRSKLY